MDKNRKRLLKVMRDIRIKEYAALTSKERLDNVRHPVMLFLRGKKLGPLFPRDEEAKIFQGMRGTIERKVKTTKAPFDDAYREKRRKKNRGRSK